jgi:hypothetical protein
MIVTLQHFEGCPSWQTADRRLRSLQGEFRFTLRHQLVETPEAAEELSFRGSPTVLVDGVDAFAEGHEPFGLSCRIFATPDGPAGSPTTEQLRAVLGAVGVGTKLATHA